MKNIFSILILLSLIMFSMCSCSFHKDKLISNKNDIDVVTNSIPNNVESSSEKINETEDFTMKQINKIKMIINNENFIVNLYDNQTANEFKNTLPVTLEMNELNGNEKYFYSDKKFSTNPKVPTNINCGDIKLFGDNCIVLFYENFKTSYSYTDIGYVENIESLKNILGTDNVTIVFENL